MSCVSSPVKGSIAVEAILVGWGGAGAYLHVGSRQSHLCRCKCDKKSAPNWVHADHLLEARIVGPGDDHTTMIILRRVWLQLITNESLGFHDLGHITISFCCLRLFISTMLQALKKWQTLARVNFKINLQNQREKDDYLCADIYHIIAYFFRPARCFNAINRKYSV